MRLESLSTLQRKLILELLKGDPNYWGRLKSQFYSWKAQREMIEEFIRKHALEVYKLFAGEGLLRVG